jgi:hypothetical protein
MTIFGDLIEELLEFFFSFTEVYIPINTEGYKEALGVTLMILSPPVC